MLKKISAAVLLSCIVNITGACAECISDSTVTINIDTNTNICTLDLVSEVTNNEGIPASLFVASYFEGRLMNVQTYSVNASKTVSDKLICKKSTGETVTPDSVKAYIWQSGTVKPLSETENVFSEVKLQNANKTFMDNLAIVLSEIPKQEWREWEEEIITILKNCGNDVITLKEKCLLTPEFVQRYYNEDLINIKTLWDNLTGAEKGNLWGRICEMGDDKCTYATAYIIDYFDLKNRLFR